MPKQLLIILPDTDFDVTETSVPWTILTQGGVHVHFTTSNGQPGQCDPILLNPVVFGILGATQEAKNCYNKMVESPEYKNPAKYRDVDFMEYDGVLLPGGHAKGMIPYLEDTTIRAKLIPFIKDTSKLVSAICHGVLVLARAIDPETGRSLLYNRRSTCLPKYMERSAYYLSAWKLGGYYRTYEEYVEDEVKSCMERPDTQFDGGKCNWFGKLSEEYSSVCVDGNYVSGRWPGDAKLFGETIVGKLRG